MKFYTINDYNQLQALQFVIENVSSLPTSPTPQAGRLVYMNGALYVYTGTSWKMLTEDNINDIQGTLPIVVSINNKVATISINPATTSSAGSMSAADKAKLDGIQDNAAAVTSSVTPVNVKKDTAQIGTSAQAARADHRHSIDTGTPVSLDGLTNIEGTSTSLARADHKHALTFDGVKAALNVANTNIQFNNQRLSSVGSPNANDDAATKEYVDTRIKGMTDWKESVRVATTTNIDLNNPPSTIDGRNISAGDRVLVKNQSTASQNGIYVHDGNRLVRAPDADTSEEVTSGMCCFVSEGTVNAGTTWILSTPDPIILGTTSLTFVQVGGAGYYSMANVGTGAGVYKEMSGNQFLLRSVKANSNKLSSTQGTDEVLLDVNEGNLTLNNIGGVLGVTKGGTGLSSCLQGDIFYCSENNVISRLGKETTPTRYLSNTGTNSAPAWAQVNLANGVTGTLPIANGGTGATTAAGARSNLGATGKYATNVGNGSATQYDITHNLGTEDVIVMVRESSSNKEYIGCDIRVVNSNTVKLIFASAPSTNQFRVIVIG